MNTSGEIEKIVKLLGPEGPLSRLLPFYEPRPQQQDMLRSIVKAYHEEETLLIEAGTGTGKSLAYLLPALLWSLQKNEVTVIATHTIALQEQLLKKDVPLLLKGLNLDAKVVLVKGMNNYLCMRRLQDCSSEKALLTERENKELDLIEEWSQHTQEGSRSDLPFAPLPETWERVSAEAENCTHMKCPHYKECFFFKARKEAADAHLLIANHHLLFADLAVRAEDGNYANPCILPPYHRLVLDEAHHVEEVATEYFADRVSRPSLLRLLSRLLSDRSTGKLKALEAKIAEVYVRKEVGQDIENLFTLLEADLPHGRKELLDRLDHLFYTLGAFVAASQVEEKLRIRQQHLSDNFWLHAIQPVFEKFIDSCKAWSHTIFNLLLKVESQESLNEKCSGIIAEIKGLLRRLENVLAILYTFAFAPEEPTKVRWIEGSVPNYHLMIAELEISKLLSEYLFKKMATTVLTSATLTTHKQFGFLRTSLGITDASEAIFDSPFDYNSQVLFTVPSDIPHPDHPQFITIASEHILHAVEASRGNAFVLFTSYQMLRACLDLLQEKLQEKKFFLLCQGEESRSHLIERFKKRDRSILFGTDSFWEGVDVVGDALRCVIIVKLPFKVPSDPLFQARCESITQKGGSPFFEYSLPHAVVKFKQGFGRLVRNKNDRGCIVCLDQRLVTKGYGKLFLKSLPQCNHLFEPVSSLKEKMKAFYKF